MSAPGVAVDDREMARLEVLHGYKRFFAQDGSVPLTPFSENVIRYDTVIGSEDDVPDIHASVRKAIREELREIRRGSGRAARIVMLAGEPGVGKSHLINYFKQPELAKELGYILVSNSNHWKVDEFEEVLLDWILDALTRPSLDEPHLLLTKIQDLAFGALGQILGQAGQVERFTRRRTRWFFQRWWAKLRGADYQTIREKVDRRDDSVFKQLDYPRFARYMCDRFLRETTNPFHRYCVHVLLRYLFPSDREKVIHWLRRRGVQGEFLRGIGADDQIDRRYKVVDVIKILMSMYTPEVSKALAEENKGDPNDLLFFLAFDQIEGRDALFDAPDDWRKFFAQLSEIYNALPNVFVLFTMTLGKRTDLYGSIEAQFKDRVCAEQRFVLKSIDREEMLALYRQRIDRCIARYLPELREHLQLSGNPYLPFDATQMETVGGLGSLRVILRRFDEQFKEAIERLAVNVMLDFHYSRKAINESQHDTAYQYTSSHLTTMSDLCNSMRAALPASARLCLDEPQWRLTKEKLPVLRLHFRDLDDPGRWVRVFLVLLPFRFNAHLQSCVDLLFKKNRARYQLWLLRASAFNVPVSVTGNKAEQVFPRVLTPEEEVTLQAVLRTLEKRDQYKPEEWVTGEPFLVHQCRSTHLGDLLAGVRQMLDRESGSEEPEEEDELEPVTGTVDQPNAQLFKDQDEIGEDS